MKSWHEARFSMFIHLGLYTLLGHHEWAMGTECVPAGDYQSLTDHFNLREGPPRERAKLARQAGMKYMMFTAKHLDGYCLWYTKQTNFNSVETGPKRDLVAEYIQACRDEGLHVGIYYVRSRKTKWWSINSNLKPIRCSNGGRQYRRLSATGERRMPALRQI